MISRYLSIIATCGLLQDIIGSVVCAGFFQCIQKMEHDFALCAAERIFVAGMLDLCLHTAKFVRDFIALFVAIPHSANARSGFGGVDAVDVNDVIASGSQNLRAPASADTLCEAYFEFPRKRWIILLQYTRNARKVVSTNYENLIIFIC